MLKKDILHFLFKHPCNGCLFFYHFPGKEESKKTVFEVKRGFSFFKNSKLLKNSYGK